MSKQKTEDRKRDNHEKIELGGLVRIVYPQGSEIDKEIILGILLDMKEICGTNPSKAAEWKKRGAAELKAREESRQAARAALRQGVESGESVN